MMLAPRVHRYNRMVTVRTHEEKERSNPCNNDADHQRQQYPHVIHGTIEQMHCTAVTDEIIMPESTNRIIVTEINVR